MGFRREVEDLEIFLPCDMVHELDPKEVGQPEYREALGVSIPVYYMGFDIRFVGKKWIQDKRCLVNGPKVA